ncbi:MAG: delta-60 repeat domain-containing protein, partial [Haliscomenobacter sp.]
MKIRSRQLGLLPLLLLGFGLYAQTIDATFNPGDLGFGQGDGANSSVSTLAVQSDGKILIGGSFSSYNGTARNRVARLNADGSLDTGFNPGTGANNTVSTFAVQSDGKILIGGSFSSYNGTA